jgi:hypothetical protein
MTRRLLPICAALSLALAPAAMASDHNMRVNEVAPSEGFVELLDVLPGGEPFPESAYVVIAYDGAGTELSSQAYLPPYPFSSRTTPFVLGLAVPAGAGQVCFERARNPESTKPLEEYRLHCLGYGAVTNRVKRGMPIAPAPGAGQSAQRQPCGKAGVAAPTRGAENAELPKVCGDAPVCDDPRKADNTPPKMTVALGKSQRVGDFHATVTLSEAGDVNLRGSIVAGDLRRRTSGPIPNAFVYGPIRRDVKARTPTRIAIPLSRRARRAVKRAAKRGEQSVGYVVTIGRDDACFRNRAHSSRHVRLVP